MIRILQRTELTLKKYFLTFFQSVPQIQRNICHVRLNHLLVAHQLFINAFYRQKRLVIQMLKHNIFLQNNSLDFFLQSILIIEQLTYLETDL